MAGSGAIHAGSIQQGHLLPRPIAGGALLHPVVLAAIALLVFNDHFLKAAWPGPITGKISDFAGLVFFPLFLQALCQLALAITGRDSAPTRSQIAAAVVAVGVVFAATKLWPEANGAVSHVMGAMQWLVGQVIGIRSPGPVPVEMARDATDLVALPSLILAYALGRPR